MVDTLDRPETEQLSALDQPWVTLVWDDPVNLMSYVSWVFRSYFGFDRTEATGGREEMERHVEAMHGFGLWASMQKADA